MLLKQQSKNVLRLIANFSCSVLVSWNFEGTSVPCLAHVAVVGIVRRESGITKAFWRK